MDTQNAVSVSLDDIDVVVEGTARKVTDMPTLERVANLYASLGWPARASGGAITAEFSAPSAGRGPWDLYAVTPTAAVGGATKEPHGATRWRFDRWPDLAPPPTDRQRACPLALKRARLCSTGE